jgi:GNAT superfamily N-acetyltransferase
MNHLTRPATSQDFEKLYELGKNTPELQVSNTENFMERDEFLSAIQNPHGVFLVAELDSQIIGFIYANTSDPERPLKNKYACFVYLAVKPEFRKHGFATDLYNHCEQKLKTMGITHAYGWAHPESGILNFLKKKGFTEGHKYVWVDKKLNDN